jgi:uncharacterized protein YkwD
LLDRKPFILLLSRALIAVLVLAALPSGAVSAPSVVQESAEAEKLRALSLELVNKARADQKLPPLQIGREINEAAKAHAGDMLRRNFYSHISPEGKSIQDRYLQAGGSRWRITAENIARCTGCGADVATVEDLQRGWMNSKAHRENILRKGITQFGFSIVAQAGKPVYAVQTFTGPGVSGIAGAGEPGKKITEKESVAKALELLNKERKEAGKPALAEGASLTKAARSLMAKKKLDDFSLAQTGKLMDALPEAERDDWASLRIVAFACGGCGGEATDSDVRFFIKEWLGNASNKSMLLDGSYTHLGFALAASGQGKKVALAVIGKKQPK